MKKKTLELKSESWAMKAVQDTVTNASVICLCIKLKRPPQDLLIRLCIISVIYERLQKAVRELKRRILAVERKEERRWRREIRER